MPNPLKGGGSSAFALSFEVSLTQCFRRSRCNRIRRRRGWGGGFAFRVPNSITELWLTVQNILPLQLCSGLQPSTLLRQSEMSVALLGA